MMGFVEVLIERAIKEGQHDYARMLHRDMSMIVQAVAPPCNYEGPVNAKTTLQVSARQSHVMK